MNIAVAPGFPFPATVMDRIEFQGPKCHLAWIDTGDMEFKVVKNKSLVSEDEAILHFDYLDYLVAQCGISEKKIAVICAYTAQRTLISKV